MTTVEIPVLDYEFEEKTSMRVAMENVTFDCVYRGSSKVDGSVIVDVETGKQLVVPHLFDISKPVQTVPLLVFLLPIGKALSVMKNPEPKIEIKNARIKGQRPDLEKGIIEYYVEGEAMKIDVDIMRRSSWL